MPQAFVVAGVGVILCLAAAGAPGCAGGSGADRPAVEPLQPARAVVRGDWDDVEAAIWTAAGQMEIAVERIQVGSGDREGGREGGPGETLTATLRTILAEPVTVTARRLASQEAPRLGPGAPAGEPGDAPGERSTPARIQLEAQFGRFPEPDARATRLLELIERRLTQLQGVGAAPIR